MDIAGYAKGRGQGADIDLLTKALGVSEEQLVSIVSQQIEEERQTGVLSSQDSLKRIKTRVEELKRPKLRLVAS